MVPRDNPTLQTLSGVWRGANWHERETWELFGVLFEGHPHLVKLLLPSDFEGYPMRKEFLLMTREAKEWPGAKEPEEHKA
jgi:NADH-quinone oxidoreductase subunit C